MSNKREYKVVSLFCGCGGMDLGFEGGFKYLNKEYKRNDFKIVYSNDINESACKTYNHNFSVSSHCEDVEKISLDNIPDCDVIIGGFPCQDFSLAGKRMGFESNRGRLYKQMLRIVENKKPKIFVAENVEGIKMPIGKDSPLDKIISEFIEVGYNVQYQLFNTADYEVPQTRKRIIIIGIRRDLSKQIEFPEKILNEAKWITSKEAIEDLWDKIDKNYVANHTSNDYSKAKFDLIKKGQGNRQIDSDKPSITIRAEHHGNIEAHYNSLNSLEPKNPNYWRRLSVRECARLQSFPDTFVFPCAASSAYKQIGNAVPPVFAWHLAQTIYKLLNNSE